MVKKQSILCKCHFIRYIFLRMLRTCVMCVMSAKPMLFKYSHTLRGIRYTFSGVATDSFCHISEKGSAL